VPAPPHFLDPVLAVAERIDRARMHLRPVREDGLMCVQFTHHRGHEVRLRDGTIVSRGDPIAVIHLDNHAVRAMDVGAGWQLEGIRRGREDLQALADWTARQPTDRRPVAYYAYSILAPFAARVGFEVHEVPLTRWRRVVNWYLRGVMARWSPAGRGRLARGRTDLHAREVWLSATGLIQRYRSARDG
jgi:YkoP domain